MGCHIYNDGKSQIAVVNRRASKTIALLAWLRSIV
jgi:hypothetical protein